jgi:uncharacterized protein
VTALRENVSVALVGLGFGAALSQIGFSAWDDVHAMFVFSDLRLFLTFGFAVALLALAWVVLAKLTGASWAPRRVHPGSIAGGVLFGAGWAISGACPAVALVQLGELQLGALATLGGVVAGNWLYAEVHKRWFRWSQAQCADV